MRVNLLNSTVTPTGGFTTTGGTLTGPLTLHGNPTAPLHAATRDYVDTAIAGRAPLAHNHTLANITDWPSVVTGSEVGHLDGVNSNIQIQINNRLPLSGGVLTGALTLAGDPTLTNHAATRSYVDTIAAEARLVKVGVVLSLPQDTAPVGFLRANGAAVSQSTFSSLFSVVGHRFAEEVSTASTFTTNAALGAGAPWTQQFGFNNATELGTFVSDGTLPVNLYISSAIVTSSRVFLLGGHNGAAVINTIFSAVIQADGTLGAFTAVGTLPTVLAHSSVLVTTSRVFLFGGYTHASNTANIFSALINTDGTLGAFTVTGSLPSVQNNTPVIATSSRVFLLGGWNGSAATNTIFSAPLIGGSGLNDYSRFYNGSINTFNGAPLSGAIVVYTNNPDRNTLFALPDETLVEALSPGMNRFIRAS